MAIVLPLQIFTLGPGVVGKSYYENLAGGIDAAVTVNNLSPDPVDLVLTLVNAPVVTYTIPAFDSLTLAVNQLLVAALINTPAGPAFGFIEITSSDF